MVGGEVQGIGSSISWLAEQVEYLSLGAGMSVLVGFLFFLAIFLASVAVSAVIVRLWYWWEYRERKGR